MISWHVLSSFSGVWVDDPLDSQEDSILLDVHYCSEIVSTIEEQQIRKIRTMENDLYLPVPTSNQGAPASNLTLDEAHLPAYPTENHITTNEKFVCSNGDKQHIVLAIDKKDVITTTDKEGFSLTSWYKARESVI